MSEAFKEIHMKRMLGLALVLSLSVVPALASDHSQSVHLSGPVTVGTTQLAAGVCKVTWTGTGDNVQVTLTQNGKAVVTVPAKAVEAKNGHIALGTDNVGGVNVLQVIELDKLNLVLKSAPATGN
jgi:hypothetical protein